MSRNTGLASAPAPAPAPAAVGQTGSKVLQMAPEALRVGNSITLFGAQDDLKGFVFSEGACLYVFYCLIMSVVYSTIIWALLD